MAKRRLPLIQPAQASSEEAPRSTWQWIGFGAAATFVVWLPLSVLASAGAARLFLAASDPASLRRAAVAAWCAYALDLAAGPFAGGYLVGRWGPPGVSVREGATAGFAAAAGVAVLSCVVLRGSASGGLLLGLLLVLAVSPLMAAWGARAGSRRR